MPRRAKELSAIEVRRLGRGVHNVGGVAGLLMQVSDNGAQSWLLRVRVGDKRREIGLGAFPEVSLAKAREKAGETKEAIRNGIDPVEARKAARSALLSSQRQGLKFDFLVFEGFAGQQNILDVLCHQNGFLELVLHLIADFMQRLPRILTDAGDMLFVIQFDDRIADASDAAQHDEIDDDIRVGCCVVPERVCHAFFLCLPAHLTSLGHLRVSYFPADCYFCGQSWRNSDQNGLFVGDPR